MRAVLRLVGMVMAAVLLAVGGVLAITNADAVRAAPAALQKADPLTAMPFGDSITEGKGDGGVNGTYNGWRCSFLGRMNAAGISVDMVGPNSDGRGDCPDKQNAGFSGETIAQLTARAPGLMATYHPDLVLLTVGTNDIMCHGHQTPCSVASMQQMPQRLGVLLATIKAANPDGQIIVGTLPQIGTSAWCCDADQVAAWNAYRDAVPGVAAAHGARVMWFQRVYQSELADDNIHPAKCAYESKMAWLVFDAVGDLLFPGGNDPLWAPNSCGAASAKKG